LASFGRARSRAAVVSSGHVPDQNRTILMARGQPLSIGGEDQAIDGSVMTGAAKEFFAGGQVPELDGVITANRGHGTAVRGHGESSEAAIKAAPGAGDGEPLLAGGQLP